MASESRQPWILTGYILFAREGPKGLKVEVIARKVRKSKSSFYHHFADLEVFTGFLLAYHLERVRIIAEKEKLCTKVIPDLLNLLLEVKQDLLFNRQLRVHRNVAQFRQCFGKSGAHVSEAILGIWADMLGLSQNSTLAQQVLNLSIENFYLQLTEETLTYEWLVQYMNDLKKMVQSFENNELKKKVSVR
jgi:AcrR family transcriptional regulator